MEPKRIWILPALLLLTAAGAACAFRAEASGKQEVRHALCLVTYNVGAFNKYLRDDCRLVADILRREHPDAVCLNELDSCTRRTGGLFQLERIAALMGGWSFRFGAAMPFGGGAYGNGVMTRMEILRTLRARLPQADGAEPRALTIVETAAWMLAVTHLDYRSEAARCEQVRAIDSLVAHFAAGVSKPLFLAGDMNAEPDSETLRSLEKRWRLLTPTDRGTYPSECPDRCIDYVLLWRDSAPCRVVEARVLERSGAGDIRRASDHLPVLLEVTW